VYGGALFEMMNRIGYDAWCPGNHDFDISQENFIHIAQLARFPTLSANLVHDAGAFEPAVKDFVVVEKGGIRIGIIGLMTQELYGLVFQKNLVGIKVLSPVETAQKLIDRLDPETDLLIAVTHQGVEDDSILAAGVRGLDIIVGGHSHTRLRQPKIVNGVMIVQTGSNTENLGVLDVTVGNDRVISHDGRLIQLWSSPDRPGTPLAELIDSLQSEIHREFSEVIGTLEQDWVRGQGESGIGNFITDAQRDAAGAQVAFMNTHGIRRDVAAGPLTKLELFEVLPFRNMLGTFQLSGTQLKSVVLHHLKERTAIQTSGFTCRWRKKSNSDPEIVELNVQGEPVRDDRMYICAASDYLIGEARRYLGMEILQPIFLEQTLYTVVEGAVRNSKTISSRIEHRIREINNHE
jgi:2',3'-cyclic-nucleotide 2'-phosphodiesterase (5'-nucleotidase family)